jgi:hypothetical protein
MHDDFSTVGTDKEATMLGYGLLGTIVFVALIVWLVRAL